MTKQEEKQALRRAVRAAERTLSDSYKARSAAAVCGHLTSMPEYLAADTVFCFVGTAHEIDTRPLLDDALRRGKRLCAPLCTGVGIMEARQITSPEQLVPGAYGILEPPADAPVIPPDQIDFTVVPCVACDHAGRRLGQGGGYYDRFLAGYAGEALLLCRQALLRTDIPWEAHDVLIPTVITEQGTPA